MKIKVDPQQFIRMKMETHSRQKIQKIFNMAIKMKAVSGLAFLKCILRHIELTRELFLMEIQQGQEVFIPKDLSQDHFPYSFRYYDPIAAIVQENVNDESRQLLNMKSRVAFSIYSKSDALT